MRSSPQPGKLLFAAFLSVSFFLAPALLPVLGMIAGYFCPLPLIWVYLSYGRDNGRKTSAAALLMALLLAYLLFGRGVGISYLYQMGLAAGMGEAISRGKGRTAMLGWGVGLSGAANLGLMLGTAWFYGQDPLSFWSGYWRQAVDLLWEQMLGSGVSFPAEEAKAQILQVILALSPALLLITSSLACWLNLWVLNRLALRLRPGSEWGYGKLTNWRTPESLVWLFIAAALLFWLTEGFVSWLALNLLLLSGTLYWFQGMALANWWADQKKLPAWGRVLILTVSIFLPFLLFAVVLLGLFDLWFNWRGLNQPRGQSGGLQ